MEHSHLGCGADGRLACRYLCGKTPGRTPGVPTAKMLVLRERVLSTADLPITNHFSPIASYSGIRVTAADAE
jgi:hypothetical protein